MGGGYHAGAATRWPVHRHIGRGANPHGTDTSGGSTARNDPSTTSDDIRLDLDARRITATSTIWFTTWERGHPLIEFLARGTERTVWLDDDRITDEEVLAPSTQGRNPQAIFFGNDQEVDPGEHRLVIEHGAEPGPRKRREIQNSRFLRPWDSAAYYYFRMHDGPYPRRRARPDLEPRMTDRRLDCQFLGRYLPTNLEFDQHENEIRVRVEGFAGRDPVLITNGRIEGRERPYAYLNEHGHTLNFDAHSRSSSVFLYIGERRELDDRQFVFGRGDGSELPVYLFGPKGVGEGRNRRGEYEKSLDELVGDVNCALGSLEAEFGRFPHEGLVLYAGPQGMEYAGAAEIGGSNTYHELLHNYFGRWFCPVNGDGGWIDEALAHWFVSGENRYFQEPDGKSRMGSFSPYRRYPPKKARTLGPMLIGYLDHLLEGSGGMRSFLGGMMNENSQVPAAWTSASFEQLLEKDAGVDLDPLFARCVGLGRDADDESREGDQHE